MKAKLKVNNLKILDEKGFMLEFLTPYNEKLYCFYPASVEKDLILSSYPIGNVSVLDVVPYNAKGKLGISVHAPLEACEEIF